MTRKPIVASYNIKRPAGGTSPMRWDEMVGAIASKYYKEDELI